MRFTRRSEYAILALIYLARHRDKGYVPLAKIAKERGIPLKYLEHIAVALSRAGYLTSSKGQHGGYRLARGPEKITLARIVRLLDGPIAPSTSVSKYFYKPSPLEKEKKMIRLLKEIRNHVAHKLEATTLADIS